LATIEYASENKIERGIHRRQHLGSPEGQHP
jgi:hypothetical protein